MVEPDFIFLIREFADGEFLRITAANCAQSVFAVSEFCAVEIGSCSTFDELAFAGDIGIFAAESENDSIIFEIKHKIEKGDELEFLSPSQFEPVKVKMDEFYDTRNDKLLDVISTGHLGQSIRIPVSSDILDKLPILSVARKFIGNKT